MSAGKGASAFKIFEDENTVKYAYGSYNLNKPEHRNDEQIRDGEITISKVCFSECDTSMISEMIYSKKIIIKNCSNCWAKWKPIPIDYIVFPLLLKMFRIYKKEKAIPEKVYYDI